MSTEAAAKPLPEPTRDSKPYWDGLNEGRLLLQQCAACKRIRHYPRPVCDACYSMAVAWIANHFKNGFFIFNKGEGYEYVMTLLLCGTVLGTVGPGEWSLDCALDINDDLTGTTGLLLSLVAGGVGALLLLAVFWRPGKR